MRPSRILLMLLLVAVVWPSVSMGEIPLPDFSAYDVPDTEHPAVHRSTWREYVDVGVLVAGLALASFLAIKVRSRAGLLALGIAALVWFGFVRGGCICPIGAIQNVSMAAADSGYVIPWFVVAFFALPLVFTLFFGRTFCAAVCPLGAIQEVVAIRPVRLPMWVDQAFGLVAYFYLGLAVAVAVASNVLLICRYDPFVAFFRFGGSAGMLIFGGAFLLAGLFVARPYCRFLCPLGAILGPLSRVSWRHVRIPPNECINCRLCEDVCPYNAIQAPTVAPTPAERARGRRRLALAIIGLPLLTGLGFALGRTLEAPLAQLHPRVRLAERIQAEDAGLATDTTDASNAFRQSGESTRALYADAYRLTKRLGWAGAFFGGWVGLVIGVKLIHLSIRRRRDEYQPDAAKCVSCGRCFWYCPKEQVRRGLIDETALPVLGAQRSDGEPGTEKALAAS
jgi:ferredoxin